MKFINLFSFLLLALFVQSCALTKDSSQNNSDTISTKQAQKTQQGEESNSDKQEKSAAAKTQENKQQQVQVKSEQQGENKKAFVVQPTALKTPLSSATKKRYQLALTKLKNKKAKQAITLLDEVLALHPDLSSAHLNKALALLQQQNYQQAMLSITAAEKLNADNPYLYNLQGIVAREQGNFQLAEQAYQKALTIWPQYAQAHLNMAVMYELYRGKFALAKKCYQAYLALKPDDTKAQQWLAGLEIKLASQKAG